MPKYECVSDALESRLNGLKNTDLMDVMVVTKSRKDFKSLTDYLVGKGKSFETVTTLNTVCIYLTKKEIYSVAKKDYVTAILENELIHHTF
ncbi:hypothetical protein FJZ53_03645 [Candidatus Woesearchaeota archaeon]|nr:hypothetical protein [Candidatus Woesearchaeota archaeon]